MFVAKQTKEFLLTNEFISPKHWPTFKNTPAETNAKFQSTIINFPTKTTEVAAKLSRIDERTMGSSDLQTLLLDEQLCLK